ncbi:hypothetical protein M404DRAFT_812993 [Pisolithus tinctorius Marx 270]|uniref:Uncharacterized protein n=1 Tax=Pisolithus tinctorius Marx 270 TaxID=870435 RepID=A0A0C3IR44_PISTI|nr:hypothetical protein M404DRAFT_812993 [Pisolithus tinctorius Marx 270]
MRIMHMGERGWGVPRRPRCSDSDGDGTIYKLVSGSGSGACNTVPRLYNKNWSEEVTVVKKIRFIASGLASVENNQASSKFVIRFA